MANNQFDTTVTSLFQGMNQFLSTKTVLGDAVTVGDTTILPLVDLSFGMAAGAATGEEKKQRGNGGMGGKMSPSALLVIKDGNVRLVNVKNQDTVSKVLELVPQFISRFRSGGSESEDEGFEAAMDDVIKQSEQRMTDEEEE